MAFLFIPALFLLIAYVLLIGYYKKGFRQLKQYTSTSHQSKTRITVIIPARNEADNIEHCLRAISLQTYPKHLLEVIVVDDFSEDATVDVVEQFQFVGTRTEAVGGVEQFRSVGTPTEAVGVVSHPEVNIKLLQLKDFIQEKDINSYKKKGIEIAISQAAGELIICTDADCVAGENWISNIVSFYETTNAQFIAAPVSLSPFPFGEGLGVRWSFVQIFQTLDFATLQGITASSVYKKFHTMCNGANLAYTKKAFVAVNGFSGIDAIASGDDMLLMHKIATVFPDQVHYLKSHQALVKSATVNTWKAFFNQRIRWASKASYYDDKKIFYALVIVYLLNVATLLLLLSLFFALQNALWVIIFLLVKTIVEFWFLQPVLRFFKQSFLAKWFWACVPFHLLYTIIAGGLGKFGKYQWKGRTVK
jgi:cellulose synthase/poly-beta-1,6-N-acetylglucosamine synthase-like glycosyltransferase